MEKRAKGPLIRIARFALLLPFATMQTLGFDAFRRVLNLYDAQCMNILADMAIIHKNRCIEL